MNKALIYYYFKNKRDLPRIMLMESLKCGEDTAPLFKLVDFGGLIDEDTASDVRGSGLYRSETMNLTLVAEFFTGVIPLPGQDPPASRKLCRECGRSLSNTRLSFFRSTPRISYATRCTRRRSQQRRRPRSFTRLPEADGAVLAWCTPGNPLTVSEAFCPPGRYE